MIYLIIGIICIITISYFMIKDIYKFIRFMSINTIISGYIMIIFNNHLKNIINKNVTYLNITKLTNSVYEVARNRGLMIIIVGTIELIIYIIMIYRKRIINQ